MKTNSIKKLSVLALVSLSLVFAIGCSMEDDSPDFVEPEKQISGNWQVVQAFRNDENITALMDFSQFQISFEEDGSYSFQNYLPFLISEEGSWTLDDPRYPNYISFSGNSGQETVESQVRLPVKAGKRQISLSFSPGCSSNSYTYIFERTE